MYESGRGLIMGIVERLKNFFNNLEEICVFDIETVPDETLVNQFYTKEEIESKSDNFSFPHAYQRVVSFSYAKWRKRADEPYENQAYTIGYNMENEVEILRTVSELFSNLNSKTKFITFNGIGFDIPVLEKRSLMLMLSETNNDIIKKLSKLYLFMQKLYDDKYSHLHLDLYYVLNMKYQKGGLRLLLKQCGLNKYESYYGADVQDLCQSKQYKELYEYSKYDAYVEGRLFVELIRRLKGEVRD